MRLHSLVFLLLLQGSRGVCALQTRREDFNCIATKMHLCSNVFFLEANHVTLLKIDHKKYIINYKEIEFYLRCNLIEL